MASRGSVERWLAEADRRDPTGRRALANLRDRLRRRDPTTLVAITAAWRSWLAEPTSDQARVLYSLGEPAGPATAEHVPSLLALGRPAPPEQVVPLLGREDVAGVLARNHLGTGRDRPLVEATCRRALHDPALAALCARYHLTPADPTDRAVFLVRTQDTDDPDLLLTAALAAAADRRWDETDRLAGELVRLGARAELWRLVRALPVVEAARRMRLLGDWTPVDLDNPEEDVEYDEIFRLLSEADPDELARGRAALHEVAVRAVPVGTIGPGQGLPWRRSLVVLAAEFHHEGWVALLVGDRVNGDRDEIRDVPLVTPPLTLLAGDTPRLERGERRREWRSPDGRYVVTADPPRIEDRTVRRVLELVDRPLPALARDDWSALSAAARDVEQSAGRPAAALVRLLATVIMSQPGHTGPSGGVH